MLDKMENKNNLWLYIGITLIIIGVAILLSSWYSTHKINELHKCLKEKKSFSCYEKYNIEIYDENISYGPVRPGDNESYFRETGREIPIN